MLPAAHRLTDPAGFRHTSRRGIRAGSRTLVVHLTREPADIGTPRVGFVVSKAVGNAVMRNRVVRRLRYAMRERLEGLPASSTVVVRALPAAAAASYPELCADLDRCLVRVIG